MQKRRTPESIVAALSRSPFRRKFKLSAADRALAEAHGMPRLRGDALQLIADRLAPAWPCNDGRQTPFRGHPVFVAQHGTATCCRRCLEKWHHIAAGHVLSDAECEYVVSVILAWLAVKLRPAGAERSHPTSTPATA